MTAENLVGHQALEDWMGERVLTLADLWPTRPRAMIIGVNPAPASVDVGHYYRGRNGRTAMTRLRATGLVPPAAGGHDDDAALAAGVGFTDVVKRATPDARSLSGAELNYGRQRLNDELERRDVPLIVCVFRSAVEAILGHAGPAGIQPSRTAAGALVFRMPGPYAPKMEVSAAMGELADHLRS